LRGNNLMTIDNYASGKKIISVASYITKGSWKDLDSNDVNENLNVGAKSASAALVPLGMEGFAR